MEGAMASALPYVAPFSWSIQTYRIAAVKAITMPLK
jgi:hypothetical protein